jgi:hypothetical protein
MPPDSTRRDAVGGIAVHRSPEIRTNNGIERRMGLLHQIRLDQPLGWIAYHKHLLGGCFWRAVNFDSRWSLLEEKRVAGFHRARPRPVLLAQRRFVG